VRRGAKLFSLTAAAGELAIHLGVLPWQPGAAMAAARRLLNDWLAENGNGNPEEAAALAQVQHFIESNAARFRGWLETPASMGGRSIHGEIGWQKEDCYYIPPAVFKQDVCKGYRADFVLKLLDKRSALDKDAEDRLTKSIFKPGMRRAYGILAEKVAGVSGVSGVNDKNTNKINIVTLPHSYPTDTPLSQFTPLTPLAHQPISPSGVSETQGAARLSEALPRLPRLPQSKNELGDMKSEIHLWQAFQNGQPKYEARDSLELARDDAAFLAGFDSHKDMARQGRRLPAGIEIQEVAQ
jgi:hypothetical protein